MVARLLDRAWLGVAVVLLLITVTATLSQVAFRYLLEFPLAWTEEIARMAMICGVYAALPPAYLRGEHIVVDFFLRLLPPPLLAGAVALMKALTLAVVGYIAWGAYLQIGDSWNMSLIAVPQLSMGMIYALQLAALLSLMLAVLVTWGNRGVYLTSAEAEPEQ